MKIACYLLILYFVDGWYISKAGQNCDDACSSYGLECSAEQLEAHNEDVDSSEKVLSLLKETLGISTSATSCKSKTVNEGSKKHTAIPVFGSNKKGDFCLFSDDSLRPLTTFNCTRISYPLKEKRQRICWCYAPGNITNISIKY